MVNRHIPKRKVAFTPVAVAFLFSVERMLMCSVVWQFLTAFGYILTLDNLAQETDFPL
jgi:hypothetical protein